MSDVESDRKRLIVIMPAYMEEERITEAVMAVRKTAPRLTELGCDLRIYVVDDGSLDETGRLAHEAGADRVVRHRTNLGLGAAIRSGLSAARSDAADIVVKFDADLQHDPDDIADLIAPIVHDEAELVYGNRFDRIEYRMPFVRRAGNIIFTKLMAWLTGWPLKDSQPGIFAVGRPYLERFYLPGNYNYTQQVLLDAYHKDMRFAHVPVSFRERTTGKSFVSFRYPFKVLPQIFLLLTTLRPLRVFVPIGLSFMLLGGSIFAWNLVLWIQGVNPEPAQNVNAILGFGLFGLQTVFFGLLGHLVISQSKS